MNINYDITSPSCLVWLKGRRAGAIAGTKKAKGYWEVQVGTRETPGTSQGPPPLRRCISELEICYTYPTGSLTLNAPQCPHRGCLAYK